MNCIIANMDGEETAVIYKRLTLFSMLAIALYLAASAPAYAYTDAMAAVICTIVNILLGQAGRGIATLAVIIIGIGASLGKVTWGLAITVGVGIAAIFNAPLIVVALVPSSLNGSVGC